MRKQSFIENDLLPIESISLARFVTDIHHPLRYYHDPFPATQLFSISLSKQNIKELVQLSSDSKGKLRITELASLFSNRGRLAVARLEATLATSYELDGWEAVFRKACAGTETRNWLEEAIEDGRDVYFIVGYKTFADGAVERLNESGREHGLELRVPVSAIVEANLTPGIHLDATLDPGVDGSVLSASKAAQSFSVSGEAVYAVEYCKVSFKWYSSKTVEKSFLGQTCWKVSWVVRGSEIPDEDDVIEAVLGEDVETEEKGDEEEL